MRETMEDFFWHARLAHHQERAFNNAIDNLPANGILILTDYSMNYSHEHQDAEGAEWWSPTWGVWGRRGPCMCAGLPLVGRAVCTWHFITSVRGNIRSFSSVSSRSSYC